MHSREIGQRLSSLTTVMKEWLLAGLLLVPSGLAVRECYGRRVSLGRARTRRVHSGPSCRDIEFGKRSRSRLAKNKLAALPASSTFLSYTDHGLHSSEAGLFQRS